MTKKVVSDAGNWFYAAVVLGLFFALLGGYFLVSGPNTRSFTARSEGVISSMETKTRKGSGKVLKWTVRVRFEDSDHVPYEAEVIVTYDTKRHEEGETVTVLYNPRDPGSGCFIEGDEDLLSELSTFGIVSLVGGLVCIGGCIGYRLKAGTARAAKPGP